ncbi:MAG: carboxypeptidase regulatory-like domain-containing protein [Bacteroidota bacterium]
MKNALRQYFALRFMYILALLCGTTLSLFSQQAYKEEAVKDCGSVHGCVKLACAIPKLDPLAITKNNNICGNTKLSPRLAIGKSNGVGNTIVYLESITEGKKCDHTKKARLTQARCEYNPHILIVPPGTHLEIANNDVILHNVHAYDFLNASRSIFNIAQPLKGQCTPVKETQLTKVGLIEATCDAGHPWMSAYIMVAPHPYYAVTDANGNYTLNEVPPGTYKLKMWHEGVTVMKTEMESGKVKKYFYEEPYESANEVTVSSKGDVVSNFDLKLREQSASVQASK